MHSVAGSLPRCVLALLRIMHPGFFGCSCNKSFPSLAVEGFGHGCNFTHRIWHPIAFRNCDTRLVADVRNVKILIIPPRTHPRVPIAKAPASWLKVDLTAPDGHSQISYLTLAIQKHHFSCPWGCANETGWIQLMIQLISLSFMVRNVVCLLVDLFIYTQPPPNTDLGWGHRVYPIHWCTNNLAIDVVRVHKHGPA